ncbi:MAG TPA: homoserine kinase [Kofleriaceae bacterium]|nr:homoserine kinase [Kofleriaceae bacterium]
MKTRLEDGDVRALVDAFGLPAVTAWGEVAAGTINSNHWVEAGGRRWFLRVNEGKREEDVRYEAELVVALADAGVRTPRPATTPAGAPLVAHRGRWVSLFPWVPGVHRGAADVTPADAAAVGAALAQLHRAGLPLASRFARDGIYTTAHIAARVDAIASDPRASGDAAVAHAVAIARDELAWLAERAAERAAAPRGVIHGDLFRDNVLFEGGELVALLDFEQASSGSLLYDVAVCINAWCYGDTFDPALVRAMWRGYTEGRVMHEERALFIELRAAAMRFMVTRITDVHLPGVALPGKGFDRFQARLEAWRALGAAGLAGWLA